MCVGVYVTFNCTGKCVHAHILGLSPSASIVFNFSCAFFGLWLDRCSLLEPEQVDKIQETILEALTYILHQQHPSDRSRYGKIMSIFIELRSTTELYHSLSDRALSNIGDIAPLLWEIINLS